MKLEHIAINVPDPVAMAAWYVEHMDMKVVIATDSPPFMHFLVDKNEASMLEIYCNTAADIPDYSAIPPAVLHFAFNADNMAATRQRLMAAGATAEGEVATNARGDQLAFLRDPWNITIQLVKRSKPLI
jgi:glyoxylase I family protein